MRRLLVILSVFALVASCGGAAVDSGTTPRNRGAKKPVDEKPRDYEDENNVGMSDKRVSRWRWKGERKRCYYVVGNKCFTSETAACKAAKCRGGTKKCVSDSSAPVQVSCKK